MNIIQLQDQLRNLSDQQLMQEAHQPTGAVPPYLVLSEFKRRQSMRSEMAKPPHSTVMDDLVGSQFSGMQQPMTPPAPVDASAAMGSPTPSPTTQGIGSLPAQAMQGRLSGAPNSPMKMAAGGIVGLAGGGMLDNISTEDLMAAAQAGEIPPEVFAAEMQRRQNQMRGPMSTQDGAQTTYNIGIPDALTQPHKPFFLRGGAGMPAPNAQGNPQGTQQAAPQPDWTSPDFPPMPLPEPARQAAPGVRPQVDDPSQYPPVQGYNGLHAPLGSTLNGPIGAILKAGDPATQQQQQPSQPSQVPSISVMPRTSPPPAYTPTGEFKVPDYSAILAQLQKDKPDHLSGIKGDVEAYGNEIAKNREDAKSMGLLTAGLGIMSAGAKNPNFLGSIGEGGIPAVKEYAAAKREAMRDQGQFVGMKERLAQALQSDDAATRTMAAHLMQTQAQVEKDRILTPAQAQNYASEAWSRSVLTPAQAAAHLATANRENSLLPYDVQEKQATAKLHSAQADYYQSGGKQAVIMQLIRQSTEKDDNGQPTPSAAAAQQQLMIHDPIEVARAKAMFSPGVVGLQPNAIGYINSTRTGNPAGGMAGVPSYDINGNLNGR